MSAKWYALTAWNLIAAFLQLGFGTVWLAVAAKMPLANAMATGLVAFIIPTLIKVVIVVVLAMMIGRVMRLPIGKEY